MSVTFCSDPKEAPPALIEKVETNVNSLIGEIKMKPVKHFFCRDRMWLWFSLLLKPECFGGDKVQWLRTYPRIIKWNDGKYYVFSGTHSGVPEYGIKGDETVYYKEILEAEGEKLEYKCIGL